MATSGVEYISENECDPSTSIWIGNDCENGAYCLSSPENPYWNAGCISIEENSVNRKVKIITNLMGQNINSHNKSGFKIYRN